MAIQSPFPGMDPWLEAHWGDVHSRLINYACDQIQDQLPGALRARIQERVFLEYDTGDHRGVYPDVRVIEYPGPGAGTRTAATAIAAEPIIYHVRDEPMTQRSIEIVEVGTGHRVVTVIEVLSPANKLPGMGQRLYLQKQQECQAGSVSLVEIDLLRRGQRVTVLKPEHIVPERQSPYAAVVWRAWEPLSCELYPIPLRQRLPAIRIPLRQADPDALLDLQAMIEQVYRNGRYDDLDYRRDPDPPLQGDDAAWADRLLREKGLRQ